MRNKRGTSASRSDLCVFGTSILWGQGHKERDKIHTRIRAWLESTYGEKVAIHHYAHSGALLRDESTRCQKRIHGEVPAPHPSVSRQVGSSRAGRGGRRVRILIDGGINDVDVFNIVNPKYPVATLKARVKECCHDHLREVLLQIDQAFPTAQSYVLGYYQIIAGSARKSEIEQLLLALNICSLHELDRTNFVSRVVENCRVFWQESTKQIRAATADVHRNASGSFTFVESGIKASEGLFGKPSLLWPPLPTDPMNGTRLIECPRAIERGCTGVYCFLAATGHPNVRGALRYAKSLKAVM